MGGEKHIFLTRIRVHIQGWGDNCLTAESNWIYPFMVRVNNCMEIAPWSIIMSINDSYQEPTLSTLNIPHQCGCVLYSSSKIQFYWRSGFPYILQRILMHLTNNELPIDDILSLTSGRTKFKIIIVSLLPGESDLAPRGKSNKSLHLLIMQFGIRVPFI